jgi:hypothetical protein
VGAFIVTPATNELALTVKVCALEVVPCVVLNPDREETLTVIRLGAIPVGYTILPILITCAFITKADSNRTINDISLFIMMIVL